MFNLLIFSVFCAKNGFFSSLTPSLARINVLKLPVRMRLASKSCFGYAQFIAFHFSFFMLRLSTAQFTFRFSCFGPAQHIAFHFSLFTFHFSLNNLHPYRTMQTPPLVTIIFLQVQHRLGLSRICCLPTAIPPGRNHSIFFRGQFFKQTQSMTLHDLLSLVFAI